MRDCFELVDISAYMFGCGLLLPVVNLIGRDSPMATVFCSHCHSNPILHCTIPFSLSQLNRFLLERYAYVLLFVGLAFLVMTLVAGIYRWAFVA